MYAALLSWCLFQVSVVLLWSLCGPVAPVVLSSCAPKGLAGSMIFCGAGHEWPHTRLIWEKGFTLGSVFMQMYCAVCVVHQAFPPRGLSASSSHRRDEAEPWRADGTRSQRVLAEYAPHLEAVLLVTAQSSLPEALSTNQKMKRKNSTLPPHPAFSS